MQFTDVEIVDVDSTEVHSSIYSLPAIPRIGDYVLLQDGSVIDSTYLSVKVLEVLICAKEASPPRQSYITLFVEKTPGRDFSVRPRRKRACSI